MTEPTLISFAVEYACRPWTTNAERAGHRWTRIEKTREWRLAFQLLSSELRPPRLAWCEIIAEPWLLNRRGMQDTGACHPAVKAAVDGLVDAGIITDDTPDIVRKITYLAPQTGRDALTLIVTGEKA